jgi:Heterokaryon incompatibility protein (HET)
VVKDAIDLTRRLGLQYIWIDALCIVQDSPRSWKLNADNMDIIYGSAELTICAADGQNAAAGLKAMRPEGRSHHQHMAHCAPGVRLVVTRPPEMYIKKSRWNTRAWTFQERLLSNRCLIFTAGRVYFQCRSTGMSEDIYADREGAGWSLDFVDAPMQMFKQLPLRAFWVYTKVLTLYTHRELTQPSDILAAFGGMKNLFKKTMKAPFIFGLPSSHFDLAFLWQHTKPVEPRKLEHSPESKHDQNMDGLPTWCWSGWEGAEAAYTNEMLGDCLDNVHEWLDKHTWIKWHIRDGRGDLRPLWGEVLWRNDKSEDERWRGYKSERSAWPASMRPRIGRRVAFEDDYDRSYSGRRHGRSWVSMDDRRSTESNGLGYSRYDRAPRATDYHVPYSRNSRRSNFYEDTRDTVIRHHEITRDPDSGRGERSPSLGSYDSDREDRQEHDREFRRSRSTPYAEEEDIIYIQRQPAPTGPIPLSPPPPLPPPGPPPGPPSGTFDDPGSVASNYRYHQPPAGEWNERTTSYDSRRDFTSPRPSRGSYYEHHSSSGPPPPPSSGPGHTSEFFDQFFDHGSHANPEAMQANPKFNITLREYPYNVVMAGFDPYSDNSEHPLMPILQFWTYHTSLYITSAAPISPDSGLIRCHIGDPIGDWCGSIILDSTWLRSKTTAKQEFIALSEAKKFTQDECETWTYYIPKEREQSESEWDLYYVLLVERKDEMWERVGVGKVFKEAFRGSVWKEIMLG